MRKEIVYSLAALTGIPVMVNAASVTAVGSTAKVIATGEVEVTPTNGANLVPGKKYTIDFPNLWCQEDLTVSIINGSETITDIIKAGQSTVEFELTQPGAVVIKVTPQTNKEYRFDAPLINLDYDFEGAAALLQRDLSPIALMIKQFSNDNKTPDVSCYNDLQGIINEILKYDSLETADGKGATYEKIYKKYKLYEVSYNTDGTLKEFDPVNNPLKKAIDSLAAEAKAHEDAYLQEQLDLLKAREDSLVQANPELATGELKKALDKKIAAIQKDIDDFTTNNDYTPLWDKASDLVGDDKAIMDSLTNGKPTNLNKMIEDAIASSVFYKETAKAYVDSLIADFKAMRDDLMDNLTAIKNSDAATLKTNAAAKLNGKGGAETTGLNKCALNVKKAFQDGKLGDDANPEWAGTKGLKAAADSTFKADSALVEQFDSLGKYLVYIDSVKGANKDAKFAIADFNPGTGDYASPFLSIPFQEEKYKSVWAKFPALKTSLKADAEKACTDLKDSVLAISTDAKKMAALEPAFKGVTDSLKNYDDLAPLAKIADSLAYIKNYWELKQDTLDQIQDSLGIAPDYQWRTQLVALNDSAFKSWKPLSIDSINYAINYQDTAVVSKLTLATATAAKATEVGKVFDDIKKQIDSFFDQTNEAMEIFARVDTTIAALKDSLDEVRNAVKNTEIYNNSIDVKGTEVGNYKAKLDKLEKGKAADKPKSLALIKKQLQDAMAARGAEGDATGRSDKDSTHTELMKALSDSLFGAKKDSANLMTEIKNLKDNWEKDLKAYQDQLNDDAMTALRQSVKDMCDSLHNDSNRIMKPFGDGTTLKQLKDTYGKAVAELDTMIKMIFQDLDTLSEKDARDMAAKPNDKARFDTLGIYAKKLRELIKKMDIVKERAARAIKEVAENKKALKEAEEQLALVEDELKKARALVAADGNNWYNEKGACNEVWENGENGEQDWYRAQIGGPKLDATKADSIITDTLLAETCDSLYRILKSDINDSFEEETLKADLSGYKTTATNLIAKIKKAMADMKKKQDNWTAYKNFEPFYTAIEAVLVSEEPDINRVETAETATNKPTALQHYLDVLDDMKFEYQGNRQQDIDLEAAADSMGLRDAIYDDYRKEALLTTENISRRTQQCTELMTKIQQISDRAQANKDHYSASYNDNGLKAVWNKVKDEIDAANKKIEDTYFFADKGDVEDRITSFENAWKQVQPDTLYKYGQLEDPTNNWTGKYIESLNKLKGIQTDLAAYLTQLDENYNELAAQTNQQYINKIKSKTEETREIYKGAVKTQDEFKRLTNPTLIEALVDSIADKDRQYNDTLAGYPGKINQASSTALDAMAAFMQENPNQPYKADAGVQHGKDTAALHKLGEEMQELEAAYKKAMSDAVIKAVEDWLAANKDDILGDSVWVDSLTKLNPTMALTVSNKVADLKGKFEKLEKVLGGFKVDTVKVAELDLAMNALKDARDEFNEVINTAAKDNLKAALDKAEGIIAEAELNETFKKYLKDGEFNEPIYFARSAEALESEMSLSDEWEAQKALILTAGEEFDASADEYANIIRARGAEAVKYIFSNARDAYNAIPEIAKLVKEYAENESDFVGEKSRSSVPVQQTVFPWNNWQYGPYADLFGDFSYSMEDDASDGTLGDDDTSLNYNTLYGEGKIKQRRPVEEYFNLAGVLYDFIKNNEYTQFKENTSVYEGIKSHLDEVKEQLADAITAADQYVVNERMQLEESYRNVQFGDRDSLNTSGAFYQIRDSIYSFLTDKQDELNLTGLTAEAQDTAKWEELAREVSVVMTMKRDSDNIITPTLFEDEYAYLQNRKSDMINLFNEISANAANISPEAHAAAKEWETKILDLYADLDSIAALDSVTVNGKKVPNSPDQLLPFQAAAATLMQQLTAAAEADGIYALETARKEFAVVDSLISAQISKVETLVKENEQFYTQTQLTQVKEIISNLKTEVNSIMEDVKNDGNLLFYKDEYWDKIALAVQNMLIAQSNLAQDIDFTLMYDCMWFQERINQIQEEKDKVVAALQSEFSVDRSDDADYSYRLGRIQMHIDKAAALIADLKEDGEAYYAPTGEKLDRQGVWAIFNETLELIDELHKILREAATEDVIDMADDLYEQIDGLEIDDSKFLAAEAKLFQDQLDALTQEVEDFNDDAYDGTNYPDYNRMKTWAEELQKKIDALKKALGDALIHPNLRGDVNGDGNVDWSDFSDLINIVKDPDYEFADGEFERADIDGDGYVDVTDIIVLRQYFVDGEVWADEAIEARGTSDSKDAISVQNLGTQDGVTRVAINLTNEQSYRALQLDLNLNGAIVKGVSLGERTTGNLVSAEGQNGNYRLFTVPATGEGISGNSGAVVYLDIQGAAELTGTATFTTQNLKSQRFDLSGTTAIDKIKDAAAAAGQKIYNLGGRMMDGLKKGVNILRGENGTQKVIKK